MTASAVRRPGAAGTIAWAASQAGVVLPVRVRAWDGSEAGPTRRADRGAALSARAAPYPVAAR